MSADFLRDLEVDCLMAVRTLNKERYYEYEWPILELIRQAKHYQQLTESMLSGVVGHPLDENNARLEKARETNDWYRYKEDEEFDGC